MHNKLGRKKRQPFNTLLHVFPWLNLLTGAKNSNFGACSSRNWYY